MQPAEPDDSAGYFVSFRFYYRPGIEGWARRRNDMRWSGVGPYSSMA